MNLLEQILKSLQDREFAVRKGIALASSYLGDIEPCLSGDGLCPAKVFGMADASRWKKELAEAATRLTFTNDDAIIKNFDEGTSISAGSVLEYDCTLISRQQDRDGDIIETKDWTIDERMPLLWQHLQVQPIGKHVAMLMQNEMLVDCKFAIADTELGRDAATLTKFGALRKSHGFLPTEGDPIYSEVGGKKTITGWHLKKGTTFEGSLVSVPANAAAEIHTLYAKEFDGICTAFSRNGLKNELVKSWAKGLYDQRKVQLPGTGLAAPDKSFSDRYQFNSLAERWQDVETKEYVSAREVGLSRQEEPTTKKGSQPQDNRKQLSCECKTKKRIDDSIKKHLEAALPEGESVQDSFDEITKQAADRQDKILAVKSLYGVMHNYLPGSWEHTEYELELGAEGHLKDKGVRFSSDSYVHLLATYEGKGIVCVTDYHDGYPPERKCYQMAWSGGDDGPKWEGDASEVEINATVVEKLLADLQIKRPQEQSLESLSRQLMAKAIDGGDEALEALSKTSELFALLKERKEAQELDHLFSEL